MGLLDLGLGIADATVLIDDYSFDLEWFIEKFSQHAKQKRVNEELRLAEVIVNASYAGTKKGNLVYNKWKREKINIMEKIKEEENMTVFDRLKNSQQANTLFDRLKRERGQ